MKISLDCEDNFNPAVLISKNASFYLPLVKLNEEKFRSINIAGSVMKDYFQEKINVPLSTGFLKFKI